MKPKVKAQWTAKEFVNPHGVFGVEVDIWVTIHNLAELGFKHALKEIGGGEYANMVQIPMERYKAMSLEEKRRECEKEVQAMLRELTTIENRQRKAEEIRKIISQEVLTGEMLFPQVQERIPLEIIDEEFLKKAVEEAKKLVYDSPEWQKMLPLGELLTIAGNYGLDEKWYETAGYLLIEEIALKQWLVQHGHIEQELRKRKYYKLLEMLENEFKRIGKPINARDISDFLGDREFRSRVLHEGYSPTPKDARKTKEMAQAC